MRHEGVNLLTNNLLYGEKVKLTAVKEEDLAIAAEWYEHVDFMRLFDSSPAYPKTASELKEMLEGERKKHNVFMFAIRSIQTEDLVGIVDLSGIMWSHQTAWLGIAIGSQDHRGKGYGREALRLILGFAFRELNLRRVQLTVFGYNEPAIALYEKTGFKREGVFREAMHRDGKTYDTYLYGILRREWEVL